jgi:hypothetical protein
MDLIDRVLTNLPEGRSDGTFHYTNISLFSVNALSPQELPNLLQRSAAGSFDDEIEHKTQKEGKLVLSSALSPRLFQASLRHHYLSFLHVLPWSRRNREFFPRE